MILDGASLFSSGQVLTATAASENVLDLVNARDVGIGDRPTLKVAINIPVALLSAGATTLTIAAEGSTDNSTWTTYAVSPAIPKASLTVGSAHVWDIDWPRKAMGAAMPRYLRLNYTVATGPFTAGTITAALVLDRQDDFAYPAGLNVIN